MPLPYAKEVPWTELRPPRRWRFRLDGHELWSYRELAFFLALRDLRLRYRQTVFGVAWAVLQPLATVGIFSLIFSRISALRTSHAPYFVFAYAGIVIWSYTSNGVDAAARSLIEDRSLVERVYFPRLLAPIAAALPGLLDLSLSLIILAVFLASAAVGVSTTALLIPMWIVLAVLVVLGVGFWLSALNVQYRDVRYALSFGIQVWFFASPIVYPSSLVHGTGRWIYAVNPLVGVIDGFRWSVLGGPAVPASDLVSAVTGFVILIGGVMYFQAVQRRFADVI